eukprot:TRINITY_DN16470_c0_g1_i1.p1 TRINITY_DN16470_c0_g1~~TRINITY_DN16470_c0_g1_i1.p1  ORF type:complete len:203 (+),score=33.44 TRINITY_DN16470_c0_g1_i1:118-726(+)
MLGPNPMFGLPELGAGIVDDGGITMSAVISPKRRGGRVWMEGYDQVKQQQLYEAARRHHMMHVGNRILTSPERPADQTKTQTTTNVAATQTVNVVGTQTSTITPSKSTKSSAPSPSPTPTLSPTVTPIPSVASTIAPNSDNQLLELQRQNESLQKLLFDKQIECDSLLTLSSQNPAHNPWVSILPMSERIVHVTSRRPQRAL